MYKMWICFPASHTKYRFYRSIRKESKIHRKTANRRIISQDDQVAIRIVTGCEFQSSRILHLRLRLTAMLRFMKTIQEGFAIHALSCQGRDDIHEKNARSAVKLALREIITGLRRTAFQRSPFRLNSRVMRRI